MPVRPTQDDNQYNSQAANQRTQQAYNNLVNRQRGVTAQHGDDPSKTRALGPAGQLFAGMANIAQEAFSSGRFADAQNRIQQRRDAGENITPIDQIKEVGFGGVIDLISRGMFASAPLSIATEAEGLTGIPYLESDSTGKYVSENNINIGRRAADLIYGGIEPLSTVVGSGAVAARGVGGMLNEGTKAQKFFSNWGKMAGSVARSAGSEAAEEGIQSIAEQYRGAGDDSKGQWGWSNVDLRQAGTEAAWGAVAGGVTHGAARLGEIAVNGAAKVGANQQREDEASSQVGDADQTVNDELFNLRDALNAEHEFFINPYLRAQQKSAEQMKAKQQGSFSGKFVSSVLATNPRRGTNGVMGLTDFTVTADIFASIWNRSSNELDIITVDDVQYDHGFQGLKNVLIQLDTNNIIQAAVDNYNDSRTRANGRALAKAVNTVMNNSGQTFTGVFWKNPGAERTGQIAMTFCGVDERGSSATEIICNPVITSFMNVDGDGDLSSIFFDVALSQDNSTVIRTNKFENVSHLLDTLNRFGRLYGDDFGQYLRDISTRAYKYQSRNDIDQFKSEATELLNIMDEWLQNNNVVNSDERQRILCLYLKLLFQKAQGSVDIDVAHEIMRDVNPQYHYFDGYADRASSYEVLLDNLRAISQRGGFQAGQETEANVEGLIARLTAKFLENERAILSDDFTVEKTAEEINQILDSYEIPSWLNADFTKPTDFEKFEFPSLIYEWLTGAYVSPNTIEGAEILRTSIGGAFQTSKTYQGWASGTDINTFLTKYFRSTSPGEHPATALSALYYAHLTEKMLEIDVENNGNAMRKLLIGDGGVSKCEIFDIIELAKEAEKEVRPEFSDIIQKTNLGEITNNEVFLPPSFNGTQDESVTTDLQSEIDAFASMFPGLDITDIYVDGVQLPIPENKRGMSVEQYVNSFSNLMRLESVRDDSVAAQTDRQHQILDGLKNVYVHKVARMEMSARSDDKLFGLTAKNLNEIFRRVNSRGGKITGFEWIALKHWLGNLYGATHDSALLDMGSTESSVQTILSDQHVINIFMENGVYRENITISDLLKLQTIKMIEANFSPVQKAINDLKDCLNSDGTIRDSTRYSVVERVLMEQLESIGRINPLYDFLARAVADKMEQNPTGYDQWLTPLDTFYSPKNTYEHLCQYLKDTDLNFVTSEGNDGIVPLFTWAAESIYDVGNSFGISKRFKDATEQAIRGERIFPLNAALGEVAALENVVQTNPGVSVFKMAQDAAKFYRVGTTNASLALQAVSKFVLSGADKDKGVNDIGSSMSYAEQNVVRYGQLNGLVDSVEYGSRTHHMDTVFENPVFLKEFLFNSDSDALEQEYHYFIASDGTCYKMTALDFWSAISGVPVNTVRDLTDNNSIFIQAIKNVPQLALVAGRLQFVATGSEGALNYRIGYDTENLLSGFISERDLTSYYRQNFEHSEQRREDNAEYCMKTLWFDLCGDVKTRALIMSCFVPGVTTEDGLAQMDVKKMEEAINNSVPLIVGYLARVHAMDDSEKENEMRKFKQRAITTILRNAGVAVSQANVSQLLNDARQNGTYGASGFGDEQAANKFFAKIVGDKLIDAMGYAINPDQRDTLDQALSQLEDLFYNTYRLGGVRDILEVLGGLYNEGKISTLSPESKRFLHALTYLMAIESLDISSSYTTDTSFIQGATSILRNAFHDIGMSDEDVENFVHIAQEDLKSETLQGEYLNELKEELSDLIDLENASPDISGSFLNHVEYINKDAETRRQEILAFTDRHNIGGEVLSKGFSRDGDASRQKWANFSEVTKLIRTINRVTLQEYATGAGLHQYLLFDVGAVNIYGEMCDAFQELLTGENGVFDRWDREFSEKFSQNSWKLTEFLETIGVGSASTDDLFRSINVGDPARDTLFSRVYNGSAASSVEPQVSDACSRLRTTATVGWLKDADTQSRQITNDTVDLEEAIQDARLNAKHYQFATCLVQIFNNGEQTPVSESLIETSVEALEAVRRTLGANQTARVSYYKNGPWCIYAGDIAFQSSDFGFQPTNDAPYGRLVARIKAIIKEFSFIPAEPLALKFKKNPSLRSKLFEADPEISSSVINAGDIASEVQRIKRSRIGQQSSAYCDLQEGSLAESLFYLMVDFRDKAKNEIKNTVENSAARKDATKGKISDSDYITLTNFLTPTLEISLDDGTFYSVPVYRLRASEAQALENEILQLTQDTSRQVVSVTMRVQSIEEIATRCTKYVADQLDRGLISSNDDDAIAEAYTKAYQLGLGYQFVDLTDSQDIQQRKQQANQFLVELQMQDWSPLAGASLLETGFSPTPVQQVAERRLVQKRRKPPVRHAAKLKKYRKKQSDLVKAAGSRIHAEFLQKFLIGSNVSTDSLFDVLSSQQISWNTFISRIDSTDIPDGVETVNIIGGFAYGMPECNAYFNDLASDFGEHGGSGAARLVVNGETGSILDYGAFEKGLDIQSNLCKQDGSVLLTYNLVPDSVDKLKKDGWVLIQSPLGVGTLWPGDTSATNGRIGMQAWIHKKWLGDPEEFIGFTPPEKWGIDAIKVCQFGRLTGDGSSIFNSDEAWVAPYYVKSITVAPLDDINVQKKFRGQQPIMERIDGYDSFDWLTGQNLTEADYIAWFDNNDIIIPKNVGGKEYTAEFLYKQLKSTVEYCVHQSATTTVKTDNISPGNMITMVRITDHNHEYLYPIYASSAFNGLSKLADRDIDFGALNVGGGIVYRLTPINRDLSQYGRIKILKSILSDKSEATGYSAESGRFNHIGSANGGYASFVGDEESALSKIINSTSFGILMSETLLGLCCANQHRIRRLNLFVDDTGAVKCHGKNMTEDDVRSLATGEDNAKNRLLIDQIISGQRDLFSVEDLMYLFGPDGINESDDIRIDSMQDDACRYLNRAIRAVFRTCKVNNVNPLHQVCSHFYNSETRSLDTEINSSGELITPDAFKGLSPRQVLAMFSVMDTTPFDMLSQDRPSNAERRERLCPISFYGYNQEPHLAKGEFDSRYLVNFDDMNHPIPLVKSYAYDSDDEMWVYTVALWRDYISDDNALLQSVSESATYGIKQSEYQMISSWLTPSQLKRLVGYSTIHAGNLSWYRKLYDEYAKARSEQRILLNMQRGEVLPDDFYERNDMFGHRIYTKEQRAKSVKALNDGLYATELKYATSRYIQFTEADFAGGDKKRLKQLGKKNQWRMTASDIFRSTNPSDSAAKERVMDLLYRFKQAALTSGTVSDAEAFRWMMYLANHETQYSHDPEARKAGDYNNHYIRIDELEKVVNQLIENIQNTGYPLSKPSQTLSHITDGNSRNLGKKSFGAMHRRMLDEYCHVFGKTSEERERIIGISKEYLLDLRDVRLKQMSLGDADYNVLKNICNFIGLSYRDIPSELDGVDSLADEFVLANPSPFMDADDYEALENYNDTIFERTPYLEIDIDSIKALKQDQRKNELAAKRLREYRAHTSGKRSKLTQQFRRGKEEDDDFGSKIFNGTIMCSLMARLATPGVFMGGRVEPMVFGNLISANLAAGRRGVGAYAIPKSCRDGVCTDAYLKSVLSPNDSITNLFANIREILLHGAQDELLSELASGQHSDLNALMESFRSRESWGLRRFFNKAVAWVSGSKTADRMQARIFYETMQQEMANRPEFQHLFQNVDPQTGLSQWQAMFEDPNLAAQTLQFFKSDSALVDIAMRALNTAYQSTAMQSTITSIIIGEIANKYPAFQWVNKTMLAPFLQYQVAVTDRMLNCFAPMMTIQYLATKLDIPILPLGRINDGGENRWVKMSDLDIERRVAVASSLKQAILIDISRMGVAAVIAMTIALGAIEPPEDDDKRCNIDEWTFFGFRVKEEWWITDLIGPVVAMAAVMYGLAEGKPNFDVLWNTMATWTYNNPLTDIDDLIDIVTDPLGFANDAYLEELESYANRAGEADPTQQEVFNAVILSSGLNWATGLFCPSIIKELYRNGQELERSYKKVYKLDAQGNIVLDSNGNPVFENASYMDQKLRKVTRSNPIAALLLNAVSGSDNQVGYLAGEMPPVVYYDPAQMETIRSLSLHNEDGTAKSDAECQQIALYVISTLLSNNDMEALYDSGFCLPYETLDYVGDVVWDIAFNGSETIQNAIVKYGINSTSGDPSVTELYNSLTAMQRNNYSFWKNFYYDKLNSDEMKRGLARYNRYATYYERDANGEWYASGFRRNRSALIPSPFIMAPGTLSNPGTTMGYDQDWATASIVTDESTGMRALIPEDRLYTTKPFEERAADGAGGTYSNSYGQYMNYYSGGGGGGGSRSSYVQTPNVSVPYSRVGDSLNPNWRPQSPSLDYLRPSFETKGSRGAYKREDF